MRKRAPPLETAEPSAKDVGVPEIVALMTGAFASIDRLGAGPRARERLLAIVPTGFGGRPCRFRPLRRLRAGPAARLVALRCASVWSAGCLASRLCFDVYRSWRGFVVGALRHAERAAHLVAVARLELGRPLFVRDLHVQRRAPGEGA